MKRQTVLLGAIALVLLAAVFVYEYTRPPTFHGSVITPPKAMPDFSLQSAHGLVKQSDFRGKYIVLFFGFTNCKDICPLTMANLREAMNQLGDAAGQVQVVFISVDWKRDTADKTNAYATAFRPDFVGLSGSQPQIDSVTKDYGVFYQLGTPDPKTGDYDVEHTTNILVLDRQGNLVLAWNYDGVTPADMVDDLKALLKQ